MYKKKHTYACIPFRTHDDKTSSIQALTMDCSHTNNKIFTKNALSFYALMPRISLFYTTADRVQIQLTAQANRVELASASRIHAVSQPPANAVR
jgi:hypothetical protein